MKIAYVFAGQGAQYPGMGRALYEKYPESRQVFEAAGSRIQELCFSGTPEELLAKKGKYYRLVQIQSAGQNEISANALLN